MYTTPYINGAAIEAPPAAFSDVINPANRQPFAKVLMAQADHMHKAIDAAYAAKDTWGHSLAAERELVLQRAAGVLENSRQEVVDLLIDEAGSTFGKAQFEVSFTDNMLGAVSGEARRIQGSVMPADVPGMMSIAIRRPLGVVAGIAPFNFP
jgi:aldehyde dehydrogenase (NAD+)